MVDRVLLPFSGPGEGVEQLSWGQRGRWISIEREGQSVTLGDDRDPAACTGVGSIAVPA